MKSGTQIHMENSNTKKKKKRKEKLQREQNYRAGNNAANIIELEGGKQEEKEEL